MPRSGRDGLQTRLPPPALPRYAAARVLRKRGDLSIHPTLPQPEIYVCQFPRSSTPPASANRFRAYAILRTATDSNLTTWNATTLGPNLPSSRFRLPRRSCHDKRERQFRDSDPEAHNEHRLCSYWAPVDESQPLL